MNNRHKYKIAINNELKDVYYFYHLPENPGMIFACTNLEESRGHYVSEAQLIQCTGLKDKNGILIWEGDILLCTVINSTYRVVWSNGQFRLKNTHVESYLKFNSEDIKVIGSILDEVEGEIPNEDIFSKGEAYKGEDGLWHHTLYLKEGGVVRYKILEDGSCMEERNEE